MITNIPNITPANHYWTTERLVTSLYTMLGDNIGGTIDTYTLRLWVNMGVIRAATFLRTFKPDYYSLRLEAVMTTANVGVNTLPYKIVNLKTPVTSQLVDAERGEKAWPTTNGYSTFVPYQFIDKVIAVHAQRGYLSQGVNLWNGTIQQLELDKFSAISNNMNDQWRQDVVWAYEDGKVMIHVGAEVLTTPAAANWYTGNLVELSVLRKPILDDLLPVDNNGLTNYGEAADIPDEAVPLVLQYAKEFGFSILGKQIDGNALQATAMTEQSLLTAFGHAPTAQPASA